MAWKVRSISMPANDRTPESFNVTGDSSAEVCPDGTKTFRSPMLLNPLRRGATSAAFACLMSISLVRAASVSPSEKPPADLAVSAVPQFVMFGFDDNPDVEPVQWIVDYLAPKKNPAGAGQAATHDGAPVRVTFYSNGKHLAALPPLAAVHRAALAAGHEMANHTHNHDHGIPFAKARWLEEIGGDEAVYRALQLPVTKRRGFRTPFLECNAATFEALMELGFTYDTSLEDGYRADENGTNYTWPFTLDDGSAGNALLVANNGGKQPVGKYPGLWEIPIHAMLVPPDSEAARLGFAPGLRARVKVAIEKNEKWEWPIESAKITGFDWNILESAEVKGEEYLAILKHTLDLRLKGNRAPLMVGTHTALYPLSKPDRRRALEQFIDYALSQPEVRIVPAIAVVEWMERPVGWKKPD